MNEFDLRALVREVVMSTGQWAAVVASGWLVLAGIVDLVVGRVIRNRNRQRPRKPPHIPEQRSRPTRRSAQSWPYGRKYDS